MPSSPLRRHLVLMGLRASGKTTLGRATAHALGASFIDLDDRTKALLGAANVREAFATAGEACFREAEARALAEVLAQPAQVIALGGGTPTAPGAAALLSAARSAGRVFVVFLDPPLDVLATRLRTEEGDRPSLTGLGVVEEIGVVAQARRPLYAALTDLRVPEALDAASFVSIITSQVGSGSSSSD
jgi:shikimate kinase